MFPVIDIIPPSALKFLVIIAVAIFAFLLAYIVTGGSSKMDDWSFSGGRWR
ncbi:MULTISPECIES: hypothetical protein [unclassified Haladaptatus]|uniref:hypothetical protein n=1 Tax=unclassified Haladaptatus TaxID=2622732 RepID=UPI0023E85184|nr:MULTISPECIES: hypothetical protein [unclassified Haladaptatus]